MRLEQITAKALEYVNYDHYLLAKAVSKRSEELNGGSAPLVDMDIKQHKAADIALHEIAEGKLTVSFEG